MRKTIIFLLVFTIVLPFPVYASKVDDKKKELDDVKGSIEQSESQLGQTKQEKQAVQLELQAIDNTIVEAEEELLNVNNQLYNKEQELEKSKEDLQIAIEAKDEQYEQSKDRLESMYKNQKVGYIEILFSSKDFWEMLNRVEYIRKIAEHDKIMLENIEEKEMEVATRTEKLEIQKDEITLMYKKQVNIKSKLEEQRNQKDVVLDALAQDEERIQSNIEEMMRISKELEKEVKKLTKESNLKYTGGKFLWPVPGNHRISSDYSTRTHPISGKQTFHTGIDIPAPFGNQVLAAAGGKVITAGWLGGYGNTVMINHGSGHVTLYGHNSSLTVSNGQTVKKGDQIAKIGSTGYSTGNHCHFEVRLNGAHTSPHNYLK